MTCSHQRRPPKSIGARQQRRLTEWYQHPSFCSSRYILESLQSPRKVQRTRGPPTVGKSRNRRKDPSRGGCWGLLCDGSPGRRAATLTLAHPRHRPGARHLGHPNGHRKMRRPEGAARDYRYQTTEYYSARYTTPAIKMAMGISRFLINAVSCAISKILRIWVGQP